MHVVRVLKISQDIHQDFDAPVEDGLGVVLNCVFDGEDHWFKALEESQKGPVVVTKLLPFLVEKWQESAQDLWVLEAISHGLSDWPYTIEHGDEGTILVSINHLVKNIKELNQKRLALFWNSFYQGWVSIACSLLNTLFRVSRLLNKLLVIILEHRLWLRVTNIIRELRQGPTSSRPQVFTLTIKLTDQERYQALQMHLNSLVWSILIRYSS